MSILKNLEKALIQEAKRDLSKFRKEINSESKEDILSSHFYKRLMTQRMKVNASDMGVIELRNKLINRYIKKADKRLSEKLVDLERVSKAKDIEEITISVEWVKNRTWGMCPKASIRVNYTDNTCKRFESARVTGCGYDKESTAIAEALNQSDGFLKELYTQKNRLSKFKLANANAIGYGSGYGILPKLEGGVGVSCMYKICKSIGFKFDKVANGKTFDVYTINR